MYSYIDRKETNIYAYKCIITLDKVKDTALKIRIFYRVYQVHTHISTHVRVYMIFIVIVLCLLYMDFLTSSHTHTHT